MSDHNARRSAFRQGLLTGSLGVLAVVALAFTLFDDSERSLPEEARAVIEDNYFEPVGGSELDEASVRGIVSELRREYDDRFSHYFSPEDLETFQAATSGEFSGVGLTVSEVDRGLRVADVLPDSPAERAEIEVGDVVVSVEGDSLAGEPVDVATARIKGEPGTEVEIGVDPVGRPPVREITLERSRVRVPAAEGELKRAPDGEQVSYVRFATFSQGAHAELRSEIERLARQGGEGLVLDLRGNGGGLLNEAILTSSLFVEDGNIVTTESRTRGTTVYEAEGEALDERPLVVLVNRDTASAAEILAAAIQVNALGTLVGEPSFGKGTFQEVIQLDEGGALDLTVGEYLTADGTSLAGEGVKPEVSATDEPRTERDEALDRALREIAAELP